MKYLLYSFWNSYSDDVCITGREFILYLIKFVISKIINFSVVYFIHSFSIVFDFSFPSFLRCDCDQPLCVRQDFSTTVSVQTETALNGDIEVRKLWQVTKIDIIETDIYPCFIEHIIEIRFTIIYEDMHIYVLLHDDIKYCILK